MGIGNALREDDGAGFAVAARLGPPARAVLQLLPELAFDVSRAARVVLVDAARDLAPGTVAWRRVDGAAVADAPLSHHVTPEGLLATARVLYGRAPETWLVSIGGRAFGYGERLSSEVDAAVARLVERLRADPELPADADRRWRRPSIA